MSFFRAFYSSIQRVLKWESPKVRQVKAALACARKMRDPDDSLTRVLQDYPVLLELCKAYIEDGDHDTAQDLIRTLFTLRDQYANWAGRREAWHIKQLAKEYLSRGQGDIAQKILRKVRNFEQGIPVSDLSTVFVPDRELLQKALDEWEIPEGQEDDHKLT